LAGFACYRETEWLSPPQKQPGGMAIRWYHGDNLRPWMDEGFCSLIND